MSGSTLPTQQRSLAITANRGVYYLSRHWLLFFSLSYGLFVSVPFLAPVLMQIGWGKSRKGHLLYLLLALPSNASAVFLFVWAARHVRPR